MERKYTVQEIEALRNVLRNKYLYGSYHGNFSGFSRSYKKSEMNSTVELQLQTHILAGHIAEDFLPQRKKDEEEED